MNAEAKPGRRVGLIIAIVVAAVVVVGVIVLFFGSIFLWTSGFTVSQ